MTVLPKVAKETLQHVVASRLFARAEQLRRLLSYIVEATIDGRESTLKETVIGVEVFDLPANFDPKSDPVVRMGMRRLRNRLRQYYGSDGAADLLVITLEPGSYVPRFAPRTETDYKRIPVAVLPFESTQERDKEADCGGFVREAILSRLGKSLVLRSVASDSVRPFCGSTVDVRSIGRLLKVPFIVQGACVVQERTIRVCTELVRTEDGQSVWSGVHEQDASAEIWTVQNAIVSELESAVLRATEATELSGISPTADNRGVYRLVVQGRYYLSQGSPEALKKSAACFSAALEHQPSSAKAWAGLAATRILMVMYHMEKAPEGWQKAKFSAEKSISCDGSLSDGYTAMGMLAAFGEFKPTLAGQHFRRSLSLHPEDSSARLANAMAYLAPLGRLQEAEDQLETVLASDPLNAKALQFMSVILYFQGRYSEAVDVALSAQDVFPENVVGLFVLANAYDRLGRQQEALKAFRRCEVALPLLRILKLSVVFAAIYQGRSRWVRPSMLAVAKLLESSARAPSAMMADLLIRLGERERAVEWMERAFRQRAFRGLYLAVDPAFELIRSDARCVRLLEELRSPADVNSQRILRGR